MTESLTPGQVRLSRRLSLVLRHRPETAGLTLDPNGWVPVADLLTALKITRADLDVVVAGNDKARFAIAAGADGVERIRANLGPILAEGLRPRSRQHVHLSPDVATALVVGRRRSADVVVLEIEAGAMAADGHVFHRSANGVWLTDAVPAACLRERSE